MSVTKWMRIRGRNINLFNDGIIGCTGFVGSNLIQQHYFSGQFNSRNIEESAGAEFDILVCAAAPGSMFEANNSPKLDKAKIEQLCQSLSKIKTRHFVLVSSIAVLADPAGKNVESTEDFQRDLAYGRNRRFLEKFCEEAFENVLILRLPALFGQQLKKNFLFDLLNPMPTMLSVTKMQRAIEVVSSEDAKILNEVYSFNPRNGMFLIDRNAFNESAASTKIERALDEHRLSAIQFTNPFSTFQFYGVDRLWRDIEVAINQGISVLHLATQPVHASQIYQVINDSAMPETVAPLHNEDMHTLHAETWGEVGPYLENASQVVSRVSSFLKNKSKVE